MTYIDVTESLKSAAVSLAVGEMVSSSSFSLEDAMSSIELMEPKMDPGCNLSVNESRLRKIRAQVTSTKLSDDGVARAADVIIDALLNWLSGQLYVQTVHASFFMTERETLPNADLGAFSHELLRLCSLLRHFLVSTGLTDEEDFIGHMFGFADDLAQARQFSPQVSNSPLDLRRQFIASLSELTAAAISGESDFIKYLGELLALSDKIAQDPQPDLSSEELELIKTSVDPNMHRNLLPPGPPRVIPPVADSATVYTKWRDLLVALKSALIRLSAGEAFASPYTLVSVLGEIRRAPGFASTFLRAFVYKQIVVRFPFQSIAKAWLEAYCGGTLKPLSKQFKEETDAFVQDSALVLNRVVYALCRTASRQHRSLKHTLDDLCVLQHRAWDLHMKVSKSKLPAGFNSKGLWSFTAVMGCNMIALNLALCVELSLIDWATEEPALVFFLLETAASVKVYILNELLGTLRTAKSVDSFIGNDMRKHTAVAALEHAFISSGLSACLAAGRQLTRTAEHTEGLERLFELRSAPLRTFPLPKNVSLNDFFAKTVENSPLSADEVMDWVDKIASLFPASDSVILGSDLSAVKKTVLNNKLALLKKTPESTLTVGTKYHWLVPCLALA